MHLTLVKLRYLLIIALIISINYLLAPHIYAKQPIKTSKNISLGWDNGLVLSSEEWEVRTGGFLFASLWSRIGNHMFFQLTGKRQILADDGPFDVYAHFHSARLYTKGFYEPLSAFRFSYYFEFGLEEGVFKLLDLYIRGRFYSGDPAVFFVSMTAGHHKEAFGFESLMDRDATTFLHRSLTSSVFSLGRNMGVSLSGGLLSILTFSSGIFIGTNRQGLVPLTTKKDVEVPLYNDNAFPSFTTRVSLLPFVWTSSKVFPFHIGGSYSLRKTGFDQGGGTLTFNFQVPPLSGQPHLVTYSGQSTEISSLFGGEFFTSFGPMWIQSEVMALHTGNSVLDTSDSDSIKTVKSAFFIYGFYAQLGVFLTPGDKRTYSPLTGLAERTRPKNPVFGGGIGAFELAIRYSYANIGINISLPSVVSSLGFSVNYYPTSFFRVSLGGNIPFLHKTEDLSETDVMNGISIILKTAVVF